MGFLFLLLCVSTLLYLCFLAAPFPVSQETADSAWSLKAPQPTCLLWLFLLILWFGGDAGATRLIAMCAVEFYHIAVGESDRACHQEH